MSTLLVFLLKSQGTLRTIASALAVVAGFLNQVSNVGIPDQATSLTVSGAGIIGLIGIIRAFIRKFFAKEIIKVADRTTSIL